MSKAGAPRKRYIALHLPRLRTWGEVEAWCKRNAPQMRVVRFGHPNAIVVCDHRAYPEMRQKVGSLSLLSSGTIKTITDRLGILPKRQKGPTGHARRHPGRPAASQSPTGRPRRGQRRGNPGFKRGS